jgi:hypothetical protein
MDLKGLKWKRKGRQGSKESLKGQGVTYNHLHIRKGKGLLFRFLAKRHPLPLNAKQFPSLDLHQHPPDPEVETRSVAI